MEDEVFHDRVSTQTESGVMMNNNSEMLLFTVICHSHLKYSTVRFTFCSTHAFMRACYEKQVLARILQS